jgi:hypothetical protein
MVYSNNASFNDSELLDHNHPNPHSRHQLKSEHNHGSAEIMTSKIH